MIKFPRFFRVPLSVRLKIAVVSWLEDSIQALITERILLFKARLIRDGIIQDIPVGGLRDSSAGDAQLPDQLALRGVRTD